MLFELEICGLRGFATKQKVKFSKPHNKLGSGLTLLVGANNSGKSTIIEAIRALAQRPRQSPSFTQGRRNLRAGDAIKIALRDELGNSITIESISPGSSETEHAISGEGINIQKVMVLPARRTFNPYFSKGLMQRQNYMNSMGFPTIRTSVVDQFSGRLFTALENKMLFNEVLEKVLDPVPDWTIDQMDTGQYYLKIATGDAAHSSEGLGEGLISLFFIIDALYDSEAEDIIVIDEPELSLHPMLQRKLANLLTEYASTRQIVLATHSPYFVDLSALENGATVARTHLENNQIVISQLTTDIVQRISGLLRNHNNPHIFGLKAQEVFFLEDNIILVEGQEDVIFYRMVQEQINQHLEGYFYGWGVGGAGNMETMTQILSELGFRKVVGILDGDKKEVANSLSESFPDYHFFAIPADDIRTKSSRSIQEVRGLLDENKIVREEFLEETTHLFNLANEYLRE